MPRYRRSKNGPSKKRAHRPDSKVDKWDKASDIPLDEEDQFHASKDKILLEDEYDGADDDADEDEVFAMDGLSEDEEGNEQDDDEEEEDDAMDVDGPSVQGRNGKSKRSGPESSESEDEEDEEEGWGKGRGAYYSSNAAQLDSDDDEANELEEKEAIRIQAKTRAELTDQDFGLDDVVQVDSALEAEMEPTVQPQPTDPQALLRHLQKTDPESFALARDWTETAHNLTITQERVAMLEEHQEEDDPILGIAHLHFQTLLCYASNLAFYLHLRASEKYSRRPELLKEHPILKRLLSLRQALVTLEEDFAPYLFDWDGEMLGEDEEEEEDLEDGELDGLLSDALLSQPQPLNGPRRPAAETAALSHVDVNPSAPPKKKRKIDTTTSFNLVEPEFIPSKPASSRQSQDITDGYGEATFLDYADAADKKDKQKALRFLTSKIESADARRKGARNNALGGDDDIPYRERKKDKEARLATEAQARAKKQGGADLDDIDPVPKATKDNDSDGDGDDPESYYDLIKQARKAKQEKKKIEYEADRAAERAIEEEINGEGPRSLTRAILANKGLTPHRSKSVRNPRVKKRQKFEKAKKKISSQKAVFKGGLAKTGHYEGERSGISRVVKSVRLS